MVSLYQDFASQDEIDAQYNPSLGNPPGLLASQAWPGRAAAARNLPQARLDIRFGPTKAEHLDIFPAGNLTAGDGAPVHVFIHGGYWRARSAADFSFIAPPLVEAGITTVIVNYALCPWVTIDEITRQVRAAIAWTWQHIGDYGGNRDAITISGHSAGGHLVAMTACTDWPGQYGLPADIVKHGTAISGLFDLAPFPYSYLQPALQLGWDQVARNSPIGLVPTAPAPPLSLIVGGDESPEFHRQSASFAAAWRAAGHEAAILDAPGRDHFSVLDGLCEPGHILHDTIVAKSRENLA